MTKQILFFSSLLMASVSSAMTLQYVGETSLKTGMQFKNTNVGGLSAIVWTDNTLYSLSDDKGKAGEPRFYEFDLTIDKKSVSISPRTVHFITGIPDQAGKKQGLDPEGFVKLPGGDVLISSEGNNDSKPREMPRIFRAGPGGAWKSDLPLSEKYLPEATGQQKKGIQGNAAFESLTSFDGGRVVFATTESALQQDVIADHEAEGDWIRIIKYENKNQAGYHAVAEYPYRIDAFRDAQNGKELFRGVSEILAVSETKLLVLERGVRIFSKTVWSNTVALYLVDLAKASDVSSLQKLADGKFTGATKTKLLDFELDLTKERPGKAVQNFEALSWGPVLADGRKSLLVMADNNFSKKEITELLVFAVEGE
ncbi:esterase-like activity of phytase family protein [Bdellovibrio bacteriovorus]